MRLAIDEARSAIARGQSPFGCVIVCDDRLVATGHNQVWLTTDPTAHAEVVAIRRACFRLAAIDLSGCDLYSTCEPCPMCASAIHWAKVSRVHYGAAIADAQQAGFSELLVSMNDLYTRGVSRVSLMPRLLTDQCAALFDEWKRQPGTKPY